MPATRSRLRFYILLTFVVGLFALVAPTFSSGTAEAKGPDKPKGKVIATWKTAGGGGAMSFGDPWNPAGAVLCLVHDSELNLDMQLPFPGAVLNEATIGCNTLLVENRGGKKSDNVSFVYDSSSPGFNAFASRITNGSDELLQVYLQVVDEEMRAHAGNSIGGDMESVVTARRVIGHSIAIPDLQGYSLDGIRLTVRKFELDVSPDGLYVGYTFGATWEFYGSKLKVTKPPKPTKHDRLQERLNDPELREYIANLDLDRGDIEEFIQSLDDDDIRNFVKKLERQNRNRRR